jgi:hypothetical protein
LAVRAQDNLADGFGVGKSVAATITVIDFQVEELSKQDSGEKS